MREIIVKNTSIPMRLDRYLRSSDHHMTQGVIEKALRLGKIKVNSKKATAKDRVQNGDIINIFARNLVQTSATTTIDNPLAEALAKKLLGPYLLYEDELLIAINKPPGLATQGGSKINICVDDALQFLNTKNSTEYRLVHRLDRDTSGILLIAKTRDAAILLTDGFTKQLISKTYLALLSTCPQEPKGQISSYLLKNSDFEVKSYSEAIAGSKLAITDYELLSSTNNKILVKFFPTTGRMHQLRVHAKELGCPIMGDRRYNGKDASRLMLHAEKLIISDKVLGYEIILHCPANFSDF